MAITADTKENLLTAALEHASTVHGLQETRGLKDEYRGGIKKGAPPA
jgi:predicted small metal-binding protein